MGEGGGSDVTGEETDSCLTLVAAPADVEICFESFSCRALPVCATRGADFTRSLSWGLEITTGGDSEERTSRELQDASACDRVFFDLRDSI